MHLRELHQRSDVIRRREHLELDERLLDAIADARVRQIRRVCDVHARAVGRVHLVHDRRRGRDEPEVVLALQTLLYDLHVQQAEEPASKPEAHGARLLRLVAQRRVVDLQLPERDSQVLVLVAVRGEQAAVHHRRRLGVPRERLRRRILRRRDRVSHARVRD
eukprot:12089-Pelagococcus_subviridis.AAC.1